MDLSNINSITIFKNYISAMCENLDNKNIPDKIDLIIDGGAFNGSFAYGILLYIKELEKIQMTKVERISGTSIGAVLGLLYLTNNLENEINNFNEILNNFKNTLQLSNVKTIIANIVNKYINDPTILNNKLFITYYDVKNMKQIMVNTYTNKEELIEILVRSIFVPILIDGSIFYKDDYCDGITPHIFKEKNNILFINLITLKNLTTILNTKNEINIWSRLITGVVDINNFLNNRGSLFCSYMYESSKLALYIRLYICIALIILLRIFIIFKSFIPSKLLENKYIQKFKELGIIAYQDLFNYLFI